ncbi:hypothetical protein BEH94_03765 [Candidatus Altiarchaeales archaeon WOR_SM1_SCG]|nr:hypothetical protein BEH94_03765 [Candidatus Altiarchaeales archaeon WOR_SM1_SCG]
MKIMEHKLKEAEAVANDEKKEIIVKEVSLVLSDDEIKELISSLKRLLKDNDQHFHLSEDEFADESTEITVYHEKCYAGGHVTSSRIFIAEDDDEMDDSERVLVLESSERNLRFEDALSAAIYLVEMEHYPDKPCKECRKTIKILREAKKHLWSMAIGNNSVQQAYKGMVDFKKRGNKP